MVAASNAPRLRTPPRHRKRRVRAFQRRRVSRRAIVRLEDRSAWRAETGNGLSLRCRRLPRVGRSALPLAPSSGGSRPMETVMPILVGGLVAAGLYLMLRRNALAIFVGLVILSHGVNLAIFTAGGLRGEPPIRDEPHAESLVVADPLAQAMILTSIVIGL